MASVWRSPSLLNRASSPMPPASSSHQDEQQSHTSPLSLARPQQVERPSSASGAWQSPSVRARAAAAAAAASASPSSGDVGNKESGNNQSGSVGGGGGSLVPSISIGHAPVAQHQAHYQHGHQGQAQGQGQSQGTGHHHHSGNSVAHKGSSGVNSSTNSSANNGNSTPLNLEALAAKFAGSKEVAEKYSDLQLSPSLPQGGFPGSEKPSSRNGSGNANGSLSSSSPSSNNAGGGNGNSALSTTSNSVLRQKLNRGNSFQNNASSTSSPAAASSVASPPSTLAASSTTLPSVSTVSSATSPSAVVAATATLPVATSPPLKNQSLPLASVSSPSTLSPMNSFSSPTTGPQSPHQYTTSTSTAKNTNTSGSAKENSNNVNNSTGVSGNNGTANSSIHASTLTSSSPISTTGTTPSPPNSSSGGLTSTVKPLGGLGNLKSPTGHLLHTTSDMRRAASHNSAFSLGLGMSVASTGHGHHDGGLQSGGGNGGGFHSLHSPLSMGSFGNTGNNNNNNNNMNGGNNSINNNNTRRSSIHGQESNSSPTRFMSTGSPLAYNSNNNNHYGGPPVIYNDKYPLQFAWTLYYDQAAAHHRQGATSTLYESGLKELCSFATVESFARHFNWVDKPHRLDNSANYHLFKQGIKPMWEDPANAQGGRWTITFPTKSNEQQLDQCWLELSFAMVGQQLEQIENLIPGDQICGLVLSKRVKADRLSVWVRDRSNVNVVNEIAVRMMKVVLRVVAQHQQQQPQVPPGSSSKGLGLEFQINAETGKGGSSSHLHGPPKVYITLDKIRKRLESEEADEKEANNVVGRIDENGGQRRRISRDASSASSPPLTSPLSSLSSSSSSSSQRKTATGLTGSEADQDVQVNSLQVTPTHQAAVY